VTLGGLVIKNQAVECAKNISSDFSSGQGDGLLGLAFDLINTVKPTPQPSPVQMMNTEGVTPKVFMPLIYLIRGFGSVHLYAYSLHRKTWLLHLRFELAVIKR
jgi:hypothetical protein